MTKSVNLDRILEEVKQGGLVLAPGASRRATVRVGDRPEVGDVAPGPYLIVAVEPTDDPDTFEVELRRLIPPADWMPIRPQDPRAE